MLHGRLAVGVAGPTDRRLAATLGDFHRTHPAVEIVLTHHHRDPLLAAVASGGVDAAVLGVGIEPIPPDVRVREVAVEPLVLGVGRRHPLSRQETTTLRQLRGLPMITLTPGSGLRTLLEKACRDAGYVPRIAAETGDLRSLVDLAAEGLGVAILPRSAADGANLAVVEITPPRLERRTALAWKEPGTSPAGRAFLELAERRFDAEPRHG
jgi:DNA-binding transcriptional LysR family regulator